MKALTILAVVLGFLGLGVAAWSSVTLNTVQSSARATEASAKAMEDRVLRIEAVAESSLITTQAISPTWLFYQERAQGAAHKAGYMDIKAGAYILTPMGDEFLKPFKKEISDVVKANPALPVNEVILKVDLFPLSQEALKMDIASIQMTGILVTYIQQVR